MSSMTDFEMVETGVLHLKDAADELMYAKGADGKPDPTKPIRWHGYGPGSMKYAKALNTRQNHALDLGKRRGRTKETAEEAIRLNAEFLAACTERIENIDETPLEVFMNQKLSFTRDQIAVFQNDTANFTNGPAKS